MRYFGNRPLNKQTYKNTQTRTQTLMLFPAFADDKNTLILDALKVYTSHKKFSMLQFMTN